MPRASPWEEIRSDSDRLTTIEDMAIRLMAVSNKQHDQAMVDEAIIATEGVQLMLYTLRTMQAHSPRERPVIERYIHLLEEALKALEMVLNSFDQGFFSNR